MKKNNNDNKVIETQTVSIEDHARLLHEYTQFIKKSINSLNRTYLLGICTGLIISSIIIELFLIFIL